jgi:hypothetical protein
MSSTRVMLIRGSTIVLAVALLIVAAPVSALEVREPDGGARFEADLVRAYARCTAPDTMTLGGHRACGTPATSVCWYDVGSLKMLAADDATPTGILEFRRPFTSLLPDVCESPDYGGYIGAVDVRASGEFAAVGGESVCPSGRCTHTDSTSTFDLKFGLVFVPIIEGDNRLIDGNTETLGFSLTAPDGLPLAAVGVGVASRAPVFGFGTPAGHRVVSNLTVPSPPCLDGPFCDLPPWTSPCDFNWGEVEWTAESSEPPTAHVTMRGLAGTSPLCTTGTYQLESTVRATIKGCGDPGAPSACTLVDQTVTVPLSTKSAGIDDEVSLTVGGFGGQYVTTEILGARVLDPTGVLVAAAALPSAYRLSRPRITWKGDVLKFTAVIRAGAT